MSTLRREIMNERIKLLAEQAGYSKDMFGVGHWDMPECRKFVELIVAECLDQLLVSDPTEDFDKGIAWSAKQIKKHFGVEE